MLRKTSFLMLLLAASSVVFSLEHPSLIINGVHTNPDILGGVPLPAGADMTLMVPIDTRHRTRASFRIDGSYGSRMILRDAADMQPLAAPSDLDGINRFMWPNILLEAGLWHQLASGTKSVKEHSLNGANAWVFGAARLKYEKNSSMLPTTLFTDAQELLSASFICGLAWDSVRWLDPRTKTGLYAETSVEGSPANLNFIGGADYGRINMNMSAYVPLSGGYSAPRIQTGSFTAYLACHVEADYAFGNHIPHWTLTSFGGSLGRKGLGDMVRGAQSWGYEAPLKGYASAELRIAGPLLSRSSTLYPLGYLFVDSGIYREAPGVAASANHGVLSSTGGGIALSILNFAYAGLYGGYRFNLGDPLAASYYSQAAAPFMGFAFTMQY
ncbi:MAG: hypothetical protein QHH01_03550 [Spirochaetales bacterium]|nr:hypothetical protein [Spirochaetales bacterium]